MLPDGEVQMWKRNFAADSDVLFRPCLNRNLFDVEARLPDMDRDGIEVQVLSAVPVMW